MKQEAHLRQFKWLYLAALSIVLLMLFMAHRFKTEFAKYFKLSDFDSPDQPGSGKLMNTGTLKKLLKARKKVNFSFVFNSAYRTRSHNASVGGVDESSHMAGHAVDIHAPDNDTKIALLNALYEAGFNRFGVGATFVHADDDPDKTAFVVWNYGNDISFYKDYLHKKNAKFSR